MIIAGVIVAACVIAVILYMRQPPFGVSVAGSKNPAIVRSPQYRQGQFRNTLQTPSMTAKGGMLGGMWDMLFGRDPLHKPPGRIPAVKTDPRALPIHEEALVWFGHSSFYLQTGGKRLLFDPVFSDSASPIRFINKAFPGTMVYKPDEMPDIDCLFISHDHWDHLDYSTVSALQPRVKQVICGLGVGAHMLRWGYTKEQIQELDWNDTAELGGGFTVHATPARHFSGRGLRRNQTLWVSFVIETPERKLFYSGDSGYGPHFADIGEKFGPFDLAVMENGQYDDNWMFIHMKPEEMYKAAGELGARQLLPVHSGKFCISNHAWDEPLRRISKQAEQGTIRLLTPMIGQKVELANERQTFERWWQGVTGERGESVKRETVKP
jgi:L-ascorbate metabolism protein UlaG (beta-lactamase superfamily)